MVDFQLVAWAVVPPLVLLVYYYRRLPAALPLPRLLLFFVVGAISGFVALGLEWGFEYIAGWVVDWERLTRLLPGVALRQLVEVGPIEEGSKLGGIVLLQSLKRIHKYPRLLNLHQIEKLWKHNHELVVTSWYLQHWHHSRPKQQSTVFLATTAVALGFTAEENWIYFFNSTASILDRLIGTPVHALFSAPWGYALGVVSCSTINSGIYRGVVAKAWVNAIACHALVNILSSAPRYSEPISFLSYGLFPFLLWMFWRMEGLLRKVQRHPIVLISGRTPIHRYWQMGLALFGFILGGNAIFGLFLLARSLSLCIRSEGG